MSFKALTGMVGVGALGGIMVIVGLGMQQSVDPAPTAPEPPRVMNWEVGRMRVMGEEGPLVLLWVELDKVGECELTVETEYGETLLFPGSKGVKANAWQFALHRDEVGWQRSLPKWIKNLSLTTRLGKDERTTVLER